MKKLLIILFAFLLFQYPVNAENLRGIWVCTLGNLDYPSSPDNADLKGEADEIIKTCSELGFNSIFLQVRPSGDAIYKSKYYPYSYYLTGAQGKATDFDVLKYWIDTAHSKNIELHAWINPYRITSKGATYPLSKDNIATSHPEWVIDYDGAKYLDPGIPEVREYVVNAAKEIEKNYNIDGIHIDDYFYPGKNFPDSHTYAKYGDGMSLEEWRRNNTYLLVKSLHDNLDTCFGVSPCGIWANKGTMPNGSDTRGASAYFDMYADTLRWAKEEIIDYIAPQIYWYSGYSPADYTTLSKWWCESLQDCKTKLYIGLGDYRINDFGSDPQSPWYQGNEIEKQMKMNSQNSRIDGEIHFRYSSVANNKSLRDKIQTAYTEYKTCIYLYFNRNGIPLYVKKDHSFSISRCRSYAPENSAYARAIFTQNHQLCKKHISL